MWRVGVEGIVLNGGVGGVGWGAANCGFSWFTEFGFFLLFFFFFF